MRSLQKIIIFGWSCILLFLYCGYGDWKINVREIRLGPKANAQVILSRSQNKKILDSFEIHELRLDRSVFSENSGGNNPLKAPILFLRYVVERAIKGDNFDPGEFFIGREIPVWIRSSISDSWLAGVTPRAESLPQTESLFTETIDVGVNFVEGVVESKDDPQIGIRSFLIRAPRRAFRFDWSRFGWNVIGCSADVRRLCILPPGGTIEDDQISEMTTTLEDLFPKPTKFRWDRSRNALFLHTSGNQADEGANILFDAQYFFRFPQEGAIGLRKLFLCAIDPNQTISHDEEKEVLRDLRNELTAAGPNLLFVGECLKKRLSPEPSPLSTWYQFRIRSKYLGRRSPLWKAILERIGLFDDVAKFEVDAFGIHPFEKIFENGAWLGSSRGVLDRWAAWGKWQAFFRRMPFESAEAKEIWRTLGDRARLAQTQEDVLFFTVLTLRLRDLNSKLFRQEAANFARDQQVPAFIYFRYFHEISTREQWARIQQITSNAQRSPRPRIEIGTKIAAIFESNQ